MNDLRTGFRREGKLYGLIVSLLIPTAVGTISALLTSDARKQYHFMNKPPLSPPGWVFPVVWTVLYLMMGFACYLVYRSNREPWAKREALGLYALQLIMNFFWSILFFGHSLFLLAFWWLAALWVLVLLCTISFFRVSRTAGAMMIPYEAWLTFALYLNYAVYKLSITPMILPR